MVLIMKYIFLYIINVKELLYFVISLFDTCIFEMFVQFWDEIILLRF